MGLYGLELDRHKQRAKPKHKLSFLVAPRPRQFNEPSTDSTLSNFKTLEGRARGCDKVREILNDVQGLHWHNRNRDQGRRREIQRDRSQSHRVGSKIH